MLIAGLKLHELAPSLNDFEQGFLQGVGDATILQAIISPAEPRNPGPPGSEGASINVRACKRL